MKHQINYLIWGRDYSIDQKMAQFVPLSGDSSAIPFGMLVDMNGYYSLDYDTKTGRPLPAGEAPDGASSVKKVIVPSHFITSKSDSHNDAYANAFNHKSYLYNWGILIKNKDMNDRISGKLPVMEVAGADYEVQLSHKCLRAMGITQQDVPFAIMSLAEKNGEACMQFYYDTLDMRPVEKPLDTDGQREILLVTIPPLRTLDPVHIALEGHKSPYTYLATYPLVMRRIAEQETVGETLGQALAQNSKQSNHAAYPVGYQAENNSRKKGFGIDR